MREGLDPSAPDVLLRPRPERLLGLASVAALAATVLGWIGTPNGIDLRVDALPFEALPAGAVAFVAGISVLGGPAGAMTLTALAGTRLLLRRRRAAAGALFTATASAALVYPLLKRFFALPRPSAPLVEVSDLGFPSGHSLVSTVLWGYLAWVLFTEFRTAAEFVVVQLERVSELGQLLRNVRARVFFPGFFSALDHTGTKSCKAIS